MLSSMHDYFDSESINDTQWKRRHKLTVRDILSKNSFIVNDTKLLYSCICVKTKQ